MQQTIFLKAVKYFLIIIFLSVLIFNTGKAEVYSDSLMNNKMLDTSKVEVRTPSETTLNKYRNDKDFIYDSARAPLNFWDKIILWINNRIKELFTSRGFPVFIRYFLYLIAVVAIILVIFVLLKSNLRGIFYGKQKESKTKFNIVEEDINKVDFEKRINDAVNNKDYKLAVRLYYLKMLKKLSDKKLIDWQINKTNSIYVKEVKKADLHNNFEKLTSIFEWIWYGEFPIDEANFVKVKDIFTEFNSSIDKS